MKNSKLLEIAQKTCNPLKLRSNFSSGIVGAAILTSKGNIYTGVCIDLACGLGFCAEAAAIAQMLKNGESQIRTIVASFQNGNVATPCGRCREMILQLNKENYNTKIILSNDREILLKEYLPDHWLLDFEDDTDLHED